MSLAMSKKSKKWVERTLDIILGIIVIVIRKVKEMRIRTKPMAVAAHARGK